MHIRVYIPLSSNVYIVPEPFPIGQQLEATLSEGQVRSLQYVLPEDGLTITADVDGEANIYMSYTTRNPNFATADFITAGSGLLSYYVPPHESAKKRQAIIIVGTSLFVSVVAKQSDTFCTAYTTFGDTFKQIGKSNNSSVCNNNYVLQMIMDVYHLVCVCIRRFPPHCTDCPSVAYS